MESIIGIYKIENVINGHCYIGQSNNIIRRLNEHKWALRNNRHENDYLQKAWNKYGEQNFSIEIIEECTLEKLSEREILYIEKYDSFINGYNNTKGGEGNSQLTIEKVKPVCDLFNTGKYSPAEIGEIINFDRKRVCRYLYFGNIHGLCDYDPTKSGLKKVICITTNRVFESLKEAEEYYHIDNIGECCKHRLNYVGTDSNGTKLIWLYYDEYEQYTQEEINTYIYNILSKYDKRVVCLNNKMIFETADEASKWCGLADRQRIIKSCRNKDTYGGKDQKTKEHLVWEYYSNFMNMTDEEINNRVHRLQIHKDTKSVICLNTLEIFETPGDACNIYNCTKDELKSCCRNNRYYAGFDKNGIPLSWSYYIDYLKMSKEMIKEKIYKATLLHRTNSNVKPIICLNNNYCFKNMKAAGNWCNLSNASQIGYGIRNGIKYVGKHPISGEKLSWMYFSDYEIKYGNNNVIYIN